MKPACDALCKYLEQAAQRDQQHDGKTKTAAATATEAKEKEKEAKKGEVATIGEHLLAVLRVNKGVRLVCVLLIRNRPCCALVGMS